jgi:FMN phosphatase YigB (HAD superfamily)
MLRSLIFDLGGVIVPCDFSRGYAAIEKLCPYAAKDIPRRIASTDLVHQFETGQIEPEHFFKELSGVLELQIQYEQFREIWSSIFLPESLLPESLFAELRSRGYRLLALSNTNAIHFPAAQERYGALRYFDAASLSYEVGAMKPAPAIYEDAIAKALCRPEECFFTDDVEVYVEGARKAGMDAVQFLSPDQLMRELRARGVLS